MMLVNGSIQDQIKSVDKIITTYSPIILVNVVELFNNPLNLH